MTMLEKIDLANKELKKEFGRSVKVWGRSQRSSMYTVNKASENDANFIVWKVFTCGTDRNIELLKD